MAITNCNYLMDASLVPDCVNPLVAGYEEEALLLNFDDIVSFECLTDKPRGEWNAVVRKVGTMGYPIKMIGATPFSGTVKAGVVGASGNRTQKTVQFTFADAGLSADNKVDILHNGKFVVIMRPLHAGSDAKSKFEIIGKESPLRLTASAQDRNSADTNGGYTITLQTTEPHAGNYLWDTNYATTLADYEALKVAAVAP